MVQRSAELFIPCLVDRFLPEIGAATVNLLQMAGVDLSYNQEQTCCGQPAFNAGHPEQALKFVRHFMKLYGDSGDVIIPSGSCVAMVREHYGMVGLTPDELPTWRRMRRRVFELSEYLAAKGLLNNLRHTFHGKVLVHHSCHHLRKTSGESDLYRLLGCLSGASTIETPESRRCCGFGGVFSVKLPELSIAMAQSRIRSYLACEPDVIALADAGCILQLRGVMAQMGPSYKIPVVHYAQLFSVRTAEELADAA